MIYRLRSFFCKCKEFCGLYPELSEGTKRLLAAVPFVLLISIYVVASLIRHSNNPDDKLLPTIAQMLYSFSGIAFAPDLRNGEYRLLLDTYSSLRRIFCGVALSATLGLFMGLHMGLFPVVRSLFLGFSTFVSIIPPLAVLPILFMIFGVEETAKVALIFVGTCPLILRDIFLATSMFPRDHITKALTLGSSNLQVVYRIVLPQIMPRLINTVRLSLGPAWLFLLAAEFVASNSGLGYRIYLMRRLLAMDVIIPYVLWITILGFFCDWSLRKLMKWKYKWYLGFQQE